MQTTRHQDQAERAVTRLLCLHGLATGALVLLVNVLATLAWLLVRGPEATLPTGFHAVNTVLVLGVVVGGAWLEMRRLTEDGAHVARRLGARAIDPAADRLHRRLQNLLEELAIAARVGVPRAFVLADEPAINALAAGMDRNQSVVIVTQGALERLTRAELQGVLAHEIAHIVHGDVRLNTRLLGLNHGLRSVALLGRACMQGLWRALDRGLDHDHALEPLVRAGHALSLRGGAVLALALPGLILLAVGSLGEWAARAITAGIGRHREFHADALAVAMTGHTDGLGGALRKVLGMAEALRREGRLKAHRDPRAAVCRRHPAWQSCAHLMWVGSSSAKRWYATHPPVHERLRRIYGHLVAARIPVRLIEAEQSEPDLPTLALASAEQAGGVRPAVSEPSVAWGPIAEPMAPVAQETRTAWSETVALSLADLSGTRLVASPLPHDDTLMQAATAQWPASDAAMRLLQATREPHGAAALVVALLQGPGSKPPQWAPGWGPAIQTMGALRAAMGELPEAALQPLRWPLIELAVTRLRPLSKVARESLLETVRGVVAALGEGALREWSLYGLLRVRLAPPRRYVPNAAPPLDARGVRVLFALIGQAAHVREARIDRAANATIRALDLEPIGGMSGPLTLAALERALVGAARLPVLARPQLIRELVAVLPSDPPSDVCDFLRVLCLAIDCPPPALPTSARLAAA